MKVKVFGAGSAFKDFMALKSDSTEVVACFTNSPTTSTIMGVEVKANLTDFLEVPAEFIILALRDVGIVREQLLKFGVPRNKILSFYNNGDLELQSLIQSDVKILNSLLSFELRLPVISNMWLHPSSNYTFDSFDWVRNQTFELFALQIKEKFINGACAELGVYRGDQSSIINRLFPEKTLYLFDTFEGFCQSDIEFEFERFSESNSTDFSDTSMDMVLSKLLFPDRCIIKKGFFPDTAKGLEVNFCFVSLDVDLYAPTLAGLEYFYPRLEKGGAIFVHDYNNVRFKGVKHAVDEFINVHNCISIQIPDAAGSIVILK